MKDKTPTSARGGSRPGSETRRPMSGRQKEVNDDTWRRDVEHQRHPTPTRSKHHLTQAKDKFSTLPSRGPSKDNRLGSLDRRRGGGGGGTQSNQKWRSNHHQHHHQQQHHHQLSPIMEVDNPWASGKQPPDSNLPNGSTHLQHEEEKMKKKKKKKKQSAEEEGEKKATLGQRMKRLFTRKKADKKATPRPEDDLSSRYTEYKGPDDNETDQYAVVVPATKRTPVRDVDHDEDGLRLDSRRSSEQSKTSWYKQEVTPMGTIRTRHKTSVNKSRRQDGAKGSPVDKKTSSSPEEDATDSGSRLSKQLRFFGDTDVDENEPPTVGAAAKKKGTLREDATLRNGLLARRNRSGGESSGSETTRTPSKGGIKISNRHAGDNSSGGESTTEGEHSAGHNSHKSVVYLHSAAVSDIPGGGSATSSRRLLNDSARRSTEDLLSSGGTSSYRKTTVTRSASVLAPWRPQFHNSREIDYSSTNRQVASTLGRPPRPPSAQSNSHHPKKLVFTGPSFDEKYPPLLRNSNPAHRSPLISRVGIRNGKTRK